MVHLHPAERERLLQIVLGGADSSEAWLEARIVLLGAQQMTVEEIGEITGGDAETVLAALASAHPTESFGRPTIVSSSR